MRLLVEPIGRTPLPMATAALPGSVNGPPRVPPLFFNVAVVVVESMSFWSPHLLISIVAGILLVPSLVSRVSLVSIVSIALGRRWGFAALRVLFAVSILSLFFATCRMYFKLPDFKEAFVNKCNCFCSFTSF